MLKVSNEDAAFVLGKGGGTKRKIERVSGAQLSLDEKTLALTLLFAAAAGWESGKTCTTDDVRTLAKKDAKLSGTALAECVILDLRGETIAPEMLPRQVVVRTGHGIEDKEDTMIEPTTRMESTCFFISRCAAEEPKLLKAT